MNKLALTLSALALAIAGGAIAQDERPIYPANAEEVSYAELDKLPDWRGIWQPNIGRVTGDEPMLLGEYKTRYETETAKVAADPNYKKERETVTGHYTDVLLKENGTWKFIAWEGGDDPKK